MAETVSEVLEKIDRSALMEQLARDLPIISGEMGVNPTEIAWRTGLDKERVELIVSGKRKMKWSEYLSILFVLRDDDKGRELVDERGLFPDELKTAMTGSRN